MRAQLLGWLALMALAGPAAAQVDLEPYLRRDPFGTIKISPDGTYYAATVPLEDRTVLAILRRTDQKVMSKIGGRKDSVVDEFDWVNDTRVVLSLAERFGSKDEPWTTGELYAIDADGKTSRRIFGRFGLEEDQVNQQAAFLIDPLRGDDREVPAPALSG